MKLTKKQAQEKINDFFEDIDNKTSEQVKKIKRLAMHYKIKLQDKRKKFCKFCYSTRLKVRKITKNKKTVECEECKRLMRWKI